MNRFALIVLLSTALTGCYADAGVRPVAETAEVEYAPVRFDEHVVYFDDGGLPYYYGPDSVVVYVPSSDVRYEGYVTYYHHHHAAYRQWAARHPEHRHHAGAAVRAEANVRVR